MEGEQREFPLFVVGSGRCGSTVLYSVLNAHPQIRLQNEANITAPLLRPDFDREAVRPPTEIARQIAGCLPRQGRAKRFLARSSVWAGLAARQDGLSLKDALRDLLGDGSGAPIWGEKSIELGFALPALLSAFPHARVIHIVRDPRDAVLSFYEKRKADPIARVPTLEQWPLARFYAREWNAAQRAIAENAPAASLTVRYEDLVRDAERVVRDVCAFLGIGFRPQMLDPTAWKPDLRGEEWRGHGKLKNPISPASLGRFRELPPPLLKCIEDHAPMMEQHGYQRTQPQGRWRGQLYLELRYAKANLALRRRSRQRRIARILGHAIALTALTV